MLVAGWIRLSCRKQHQSNLWLWHFYSFSLMRFFVHSFFRFIRRRDWCLWCACCFDTNSRNCIIHIIWHKILQTPMPFSLSAVNWQPNLYPSAFGIQFDLSIYRLRNKSKHITLDLSFEIHLYAIEIRRNMKFVLPTRKIEKKLHKCDIKKVLEWFMTFHKFSRAFYFGAIVYEVTCIWTI